MKLSLFKISILLIIIGASGTIIVFSESEKLERFMTVTQTESGERERAHVIGLLEAGEILLERINRLQLQEYILFYAE